MLKTTFQLVSDSKTFAVLMQKFTKTYNTNLSTFKSSTLKHKNIPELFSDSVCNSFFLELTLQKHAKQKLKISILKLSLSKES